MEAHYSAVKSVGAGDSLRKVLSFLTVLWTVSGIGIIAGQFVPPALILPLIIVELGLIVAMLFARRAERMGRLLALSFALISGITLYPVLNSYVGMLGGEVVLGVFVSTAAVFVIYGTIGYSLTKNLSAMGKYLFIALIAIVVVSLFGLFVPFSSGLSLLISAAGVLLFSLYTIYDFNQIRHQHITDAMVPLIAVNLYLDFVNLFLHLLRIVAAFARD